VVRIGLDLDREFPLFPGRIEHVKFVDAGIHGHVESPVLDIHSHHFPFDFEVFPVALSSNSTAAVPLLRAPTLAPESATRYFTTSITGSVVALAINTFRSSRMCLRRRILAACWRPNLAL
jgi:hypothetical protein